MSRRIHLDCAGRTAREVMKRLAAEVESPKNGRRVVLLVSNLGRIHDSVSRLLRELLAWFHEREIQASIVDPSGHAGTLLRALGGSVHVEACADESEISRRLGILVVEDTPDSLEFVKTLLESAGHRVTGARTGREAIAAAGKGGFDVALVDLVLPDVDGLQVAEALERLRIPCIAMSAYLDRWSEQECRRAGFRSRLRKPFRTVDLLAALR
jgi:CheY-like chemotaxis protein